MIKNKHKVEWMIVDGSIYVRAEKDSEEYMKDSIAFNVGDRMARHIVYLHNDTLYATRER